MQRLNRPFPFFQPLLTSHPFALLLTLRSPLPPSNGGIISGHSLAWVFSLSMTDLQSIGVRDPRPFSTPSLDPFLLSFVTPTPPLWRGQMVSVGTFFDPSHRTFFPGARPFFFCGLSPFYFLFFPSLLIFSTTAAVFDIYAGFRTARLQSRPPHIRTGSRPSPCPFFLTSLRSDATRPPPFHTRHAGLPVHVSLSSPLISPLLCLPLFPRFPLRIFRTFPSL